MRQEPPSATPSAEESAVRINPERMLSGPLTWRTATEGGSSCPLKAAAAAASTALRLQIPVSASCSPFLSAPCQDAGRLTRIR